jgi:hypothetical protein
MQQTLYKFDLLGQIMGKSLQFFVDGVMASRYNKIQWDKFFEWDTPSYDTTFTAMEADIDLYPMASVIDVDSPKPKRATQGVELWNGQIPKMGHGFDLTEQDLRQYLIMIQNGGTVASKPVRDLFYNTVNKTEFGIHARLNSMAMEIISKGSLLINNANNPDGIALTKIDMKVPTVNKKYAGWDNGTSAAWTDPSATPLTDIQDTLDYMDDNFIPYDVMYFEKTLWRDFIRHANVMKEVNARKANAIATSPTTDSETRAYMLELGFPPVVVIDEKSGLQTDGITTNVSSWDQSNVVIATFGALGKVKNAYPITVPDPSKRTAFTQDGRIKIVEKADDSRVTQGFEAEALALPVLDKAKYLVIIDSSTTTSWT